MARICNTLTRTATKVLTAVAVLGFAVSTVFATARPAAADAQGCTLAPRGMVCAQLYGSGTYLRAGTVMRAKTTSYVCNFSGGLYAYWPGGGGTFLAYASYGGCVYQGGYSASQSTATEPSAT